MADTLLIVCSRVETGGEHTPNSVQENCSRCGEPIWVSPSSVSIRKKHTGSPPITICLACVPVIEKDSPLGREIDENMDEGYLCSEEQLEELRAAGVVQSREELCDLDRGLMRLLRGYDKKGAS